MINTQFKCEGKIKNGSKVITFTSNHTKFKIFKTNLILKVKVKVTSFSTPSQTFRCSINSSSWKKKFETVQFLKVKYKSLKV